MIKASCHCGTVTLEASKKTKSVVSCNCSICHRLGSLWAYYQPSEVKVSGEDSTFAYLWGDKTTLFHHCKICGSSTHYTTVKKDRIAINSRMMSLEDMKDVTIRKFDGADTWKFID